MFNGNLLTFNDPLNFAEFPLNGSRLNRGNKPEYDLDIAGSAIFTYAPGNPRGFVAGGKYAANANFKGSSAFKSKLTSLGNFTIEFYFYANATPGLGAVICRWDGPSQVWIINASVSANPYAIEFRRFEGGFTGLGTAAIFNVGQWYHIACTLNVSTGKIWVNGIQKATGTIDTHTPGAITQFYIGGETAILNGYHSDFKISDTVKTIFPSAA